MGCKQTTAKFPSIVLAASPTAPITPFYVKSALKNSRVKGKGKTERRSLIKRKATTVNKSVNFDEKVQVKSRTPTPKQTQYENTSSRFMPRQISDDDDDDIDQISSVSSISSQEDFRREQIKSSAIPSHPPLQRTLPNGLWTKNNSVAMIPSTNNNSEKHPQSLVNPTMTYRSESPNILPGNLFRVRRRVQHSVVPQPSDEINPNRLPPIPVYRSTVPVQRSLSNTNAILIEHPTSFPPDDSTAQTVYFTSTRRSTSKKTKKEK